MTLGRLSGLQLDQEVLDALSELEEEERMRAADARGPRHARSITAAVAPAADKRGSRRSHSRNFTRLTKPSEPLQPVQPLPGPTSAATSAAHPAAEPSAVEQPPPQPAGTQHAPKATVDLSRRRSGGTPVLSLQQQQQLAAEAEALAQQEQAGSRTGSVTGDSASSSPRLAESSPRRAPGEAAQHSPRTGSVASLAAIFGGARTRSKASMAALAPVDERPTHGDEAGPAEPAPPARTRSRPSMAGASSSFGGADASPREALLSGASERAAVETVQPTGAGAAPPAPLQTDAASASSAPAPADVASPMSVTSRGSQDNPSRRRSVVADAALANPVAAAAAAARSAMAIAAPPQPTRHLRTHTWALGGPGAQAPPKKAGAALAQLPQVSDDQVAVPVVLEVMDGERFVSRRTLGVVEVAKDVSLSDLRDIVSAELDDVPSDFVFVIDGMPVGRRQVRAPMPCVPCSVRPARRRPAAGAQKARVLAHGGRPDGAASQPADPRSAASSTCGARRPACGAASWGGGAPGATGSHPCGAACPTRALRASGTCREGLLVCRSAGDADHSARRQLCDHHRGAAAKRARPQARLTRGRGIDRACSAAA